MDDVVVEHNGRIATVRLNRPNRANSVTPHVVTEMGDAVERLTRTEGVDAVVLTGTGRVFCAGADVNEMYVVYQDSGVDGLCTYLAETWMPAVQRTVRKLWAAEKPLVAAFNGAATAGGLDFGLACDLRVASARAKFGESYVNLGMVPVAGGAYLLPQVVGVSAAMELLASGEIIGAERAHDLGMVDHLCEHENLQDRAHELAAKLSAGPGATFAQLKAIVRRATMTDFHEALRASYEADVALIARPEVRTRIVRVMEKYADSAPTSG